MGGSWFLFFFFQRDFIKRKMNLNPGACSGGTTGLGPVGGRTPSPFQPRGRCSPEKAQRQGSRGRAPLRLPPQHVAIYRREGDTTLAPRELDEEERSYVHGGEKGTWPEHRAPAPARCLLPRGEQLWRLSALGGSLPSSPGDEGVGDPSRRPQATLLHAAGQGSSEHRAPHGQKPSHRPSRGSPGRGKATCPRPALPKGPWAPRAEGDRQGGSKAWCQPGQGGGEIPKRGSAWTPSRQ